MSFAERSNTLDSNEAAAIDSPVIEIDRGFNHSYYQPLHTAIRKGDWKSTKAFLDRDPSASTAKITASGMNALHVAAFQGQWQLLQKLVPHVPPHVLAEFDFIGCTCLHYTATGEDTNAAKALVAKNPSLTQINDCVGRTPLIYSIIFSGCKEMVWYLVLNTTNEGPDCPFSGAQGELLVELLTTVGFHEITMYLLQLYPDLATISDKNGSIVLNVLSKLPSHFEGRDKLGFWGRCIYLCLSVELDHLPPNQLRGDLKDSHGQKSSHTRSHFGITICNALQNLVPGIKLVRDAKLRQESAVRLVGFVCSQLSAMSDWQSFLTANIAFNAVSSGAVDILRIYFLYFPDFIWEHKGKKNVAQFAIINRQEKVFSILCVMPIICKSLVFCCREENNTTSHQAARFSSPQLGSISGAAFQMQKELQWFKEVEKRDSPLNKEVENKNGETPWQLFRKEHKALLEEARIWMKDTSNSCMIVATLIATVAFAAAITVPGGNIQDKGFPMFLLDNTFLVFIVSDALAMCSSMVSLLMFLAILNARYEEMDFLKVLPHRLIIGLASLFFAIVTTMIAFGAALSLLVRERLKWAPTPIALLACVPIALFARLQLPLLIQMIISTYRSPVDHNQSIW